VVIVTDANGDARWIERALFHAARGAGRTSPNPMVGAVIVSSESVVVGEGYHTRAGEAHAEIAALEAAGSRARGATMYCTLEPCAHQGRTGPCASRIVDAGIVRVVASVVDPNPVVHGRGFEYLRAHGVQVDVGAGAGGAIALNQPFFTLMHEGRPFVILKAATSADGYMAERRDRRTYLTSAPANRHVHRSRAEVDALGVGIGTLLADDPELTARGVYRERPLVRVIFDRQLRTPPDARVLSTLDAGPVIIITSAAEPARADARRALEARGAEVLTATDGTFRSALELLGRRQIASLILEGGASLQSVAWDEGLVDFVSLYVSPMLLGPMAEAAQGRATGDASDDVRFLPNHSFSSAALLERRVEALGPDVLIEGYVHRPH